MLCSLLELKIMNISRSFKFSDNNLNQLENDQPIRTVNHSNFGRIAQYTRLSEGDDIVRSSIDSQSRITNESGMMFKYFVFVSNVIPAFRYLF